jgi:hypothetical protein
MAEEFQGILYVVDLAALRLDCAGPYFERFYTERIAI